MVTSFDKHCLHNRYTHNDEAWSLNRCCCRGRLPHGTSDQSRSVETSQHRESWHGLQMFAKVFFSWCIWVRHIRNEAKRTLPLFRSLFSYFGAEATSFLVKTFYCDTEDVIHDIANWRSTLWISKLQNQTWWCLLLPAEELIICCCALRCIALWSLEVWVTFHF